MTSGLISRADRGRISLGSQGYHPSSITNVEENISSAALTSITVIGVTACLTSFYRIRRRTLSAMLLSEQKYSVNFVVQHFGLVRLRTLYPNSVLVNPWLDVDFHGTTCPHARLTKPMHPDTTYSDVSMHYDCNSLVVAEVKKA